jgi:hypothetical protein
VATGVAIVVEDALGDRVLDVSIPGGAYDPVTRIGWWPWRWGKGWTYQNGGSAPPGGITFVSLHHIERRQPGLIEFRVKGRRGSYPVDAGKLPLSGFVSVDPPTAETGQCGAASFVSAGQQCSHGGGRVHCR